MLVWRHDKVSRFRATGREELAALFLSCAGTPFAGLCATLVDAYGEEAGVASAGTLLGRWLSDGMIGDVTAQP